MFVSMTILAVLAIFIGRIIYKSYPIEEGKKFILKEKWVSAPLHTKNQFPIIKKLKAEGWIDSKLVQDALNSGRY